MNIHILPQDPSAALMEYRKGYWLPDSTFELLPPESSPVRLLTRTEIATIRVLTPTDNLIRVAQHGVIYEAALRLAIYEQQGLLRNMSGWRVGTELQYLFYPQCRSHRNPPLRGLEILRAIDATSSEHGVRVTVGDDISINTFCRELVALAP